MEETLRARSERFLDAELPCQGLLPSLYIHVFTTQDAF